MPQIIGRDAGGAADVFAFAVFAEPNVAIDDAFAAQIDLLRHACDLHAFVDIIVAAHVMGAGADGVGALGSQTTISASVPTAIVPFCG